MNVTCLKEKIYKKDCNVLVCTNGCHFSAVFAELVRVTLVGNIIYSRPVGDQLVSSVNIRTTKVKQHCPRPIFGRVVDLDRSAKE